MLDLAVSYNKYKFIGNEYLTWLWFLIDSGESDFSDSSGTRFSIETGNRIVLERIIDDNTIETLTIKGDNAGLEEGLLAIQKGAIVTELHLKINYADQLWSFTIKGENFHFTGFKLPETEKVKDKKEIEGAVLEKIYLSTKAVELMDGIFNTFIELRCSDTWHQKIVPNIKKWAHDK